MIFDSLFITKKRKIKIVTDIVNIIVKKHNAKLMDMIIKETTEGNNSVSMDVYVSKISIDKVIEMNIEMAEKLAQLNLAGITIIPLFVLVDTDTKELHQESRKDSEEHANACY